MGDRFSFVPSDSVMCGRTYFSVELKDWDVSGDYTHSFALFGWCVSFTGKPIAVEFYVAGTPIASARLHVERPDVLENDALVHAPLNCGFHLRISKFVLPPDAEVMVQLWEERAQGGDARVYLGAISGICTEGAKSAYVSRCNPLLILGLGRSGTTYLMHLLGRHPQVVVPGVHPYEMRQPVWLWHAAHVLTAPSASTSIQPDGFETHEAERLGYNPYRSRDWEKFSACDGAMRWQEDEFPRVCIDFCKQQVDEFVDRCAVGRASPPTFIAQKMSMSPTRYFVGNVYSVVREIFLVRDFRDIWLSARSFNQRRGNASFDREKFPDDISWLRGLAFSSRQLRLSHASSGLGSQLVHFEALVQNPRGTLTTVLDRLGLESSPELISAIIGDETTENAANFEAHRTSSHSDQVGRWRVEMTPNEKAIAADVFGEDLRYFDYEV